MYIRPHLDYGDVIYHMDLVERVQYKAALIVTGCWQGTSRESLYEELGWESLSHRRWLRRLTVFYKNSKGLAPPPPLTYLTIYPSVMRLAWFYETGAIMSPYLGQIDTKTVSFHTQLKLGKILMRKQNLNPLSRALKRILRASNPWALFLWNF